MIENQAAGRTIQLGEVEEQGQSFPLMDYIQLLWFRRKLIIAITIFVTVIGYIQVSEIKDVYSATSTLMVSLPKPRIVDIESVIGRDYWSSVTDEMQLLHSTMLAGKVVERLHLLNHPEFNPSLSEPESSLFDFLDYLDPRTWIPDSWKSSLKEAVGLGARKSENKSPEDGIAQPEEDPEQLLISSAAEILLGMVGTQQVGDSNIIRITVSARDPKIAAAIANELPEAYIIDQLEAKFEITEKANAWLTDQLTELEAQVVDSERAVEIYREEHGLVETAGMNILDEQISELNSQLIIAKAEKAEVDARLSQLQRLLRSGGQGVETASEVLSSALVQQLRSQEAQALSRASELSVEYGPKHPRMLQVRAEIEELRKRIRTEVESIAVGLQHEAEFASMRVASLENSLREAQGETSDQNREAIQLRSLEREAAANRALYQTFLTRFKETSSTQELETSDARVISTAKVPVTPSYPDRGKILQKYILLGLFGACGLVLALQMLNPGMTNPEQVQHVLGEYVVGLIPSIEGKTPLHDYVLEKPNSSVVEAMNSLKFSLALSDPDHPVQAVQVTSSVPEEGKTTLAISLARVVAASGKKVIIIDGDLRRSSLGKKLGFREKSKGLSDFVAAGDEDIVEFILHDEKGKLDFLPPGSAKFANATDIFASHRMEAIIDMLKTRYDFIVVDTPPVMAVADSRIMGRVVDKTIFVVRWDKTPRKVAKAAIEQLHRAGVSLAGIVLQQVDLKRYGRVGYGDSGYYYHYGRYGKYYSAG